MKKTLFLIISNFLIISAFSQTISLDTSFGNNGILELPYDRLITNGGGSAKSILLSNDKLLFLEGGQIDGVTKSYLTRINPNGTIDTTFGTNGFVIFNYSPYDFSVKIQPDNKIVVFGSHNPVKIFRFLENGQPDSEFGVNGLAQITNVSNSYAHETTSLSGERHNLVLLPDGKILIRFLFGDGLKLKCFNSNGLPNNSFGNNSELTSLANGTNSEFISDFFFISNDNKLIGYSSNSSSYTIEKFNLNGTHDLTYGINGINNVNVAIADFNTINISQDQYARLLAKSISVSGSSIAFKSIRINQLGNLDSSFGINGISDDAFGIQNLFLSDPIIRDNKYYFGGSILNSNYDSENLAILSTNYDGSLNQNFNTNGYFIDVTPNILDGGGYIHFQSDGKILTSGIYNINDTSRRVFIKRYIDTSLGNTAFSVSDIFYSNPISENVTFSSKKQIKKITFYNSLGQKIIESKNTTLATSDIAKGIYVVKIEFEDNTSTNKKIIKE